MYMATRSQSSLIKAQIGSFMPSSTLLHSEWPRLHKVLALLSAIGLMNKTLYHLVKTKGHTVKLRYFEMPRTFNFFSNYQNFELTESAFSVLSGKSERTR